MNRKVILASAAAAWVLMFGLMPSCKSKTADARPEIVEYSGVEFRTPSMKNIECDTVFDFDGTRVASTRVSRTMAVSDSDFFISLDIYACNDNDAINGSLAKYIGEALDAFETNQDSSDKSIGVYSEKSKTVSELVATADSAVKVFSNVVIPQALADSVHAMTLAVDLRPAWANDSYITYSMSAQCYYGGAHGESDFYLLTFDSKTGAAMGFYNLVPADKQDEVRRELLDVISRSDGLNVGQYLAMVNEWVGNSREEDWTVKSFPIYHVGLTGQGYVFCYPKYSIAPGSDGCPVYVVPAE